MKNQFAQTLKDEVAKDKVVKIALGILAASIAKQAVAVAYDKGVSAYRLRGVDITE